MATVTNLHCGTAPVDRRQEGSDGRSGRGRVRVGKGHHVGWVPKELVQMGQMMPQLAK